MHELYEELSFIKDEKIRDFASAVLLDLPNYFWKIPASSTSKYHPKSSLGEGGLVRHTKCAARIAKELFIILPVDEKAQDLIIAAILIHDGLKKDYPETKYTKHEHPNLIADFINQDKYKNMISEKDLGTISNAVKRHMGQWSRNQRSKIILEEPKNRIDKLVHLSDYLSSRKFLNFDLS